MVDPHTLPPAWRDWWLQQQTSLSVDDPDAVFDEVTPPIMREEDPELEARLDEMFGIESRPQ